MPPTRSLGQGVRRHLHRDDADSVVEHAREEPMQVRRLGRRALDRDGPPVDPGARGADHRRSPAGSAGDRLQQVGRRRLPVRARDTEHRHRGGRGPEQRAPRPDPSPLGPRARAPGGPGDRATAPRGGPTPRRRAPPARDRGRRWWRRGRRRRGRPVHPARESYATSSTETAGRPAPRRRRRRRAGRQRARGERGVYGGTPTREATGSELTRAPGRGRVHGGP